MEAKERLRERTTLQYYDIYSISHSIDDPPSTRDAQIATPSKDFALTALAQLVALRLNVKRCLISLFDVERQYVIAEATRSLALRADSKAKHDDGDELWLSGCAISRSCGFCEHVLLPPAQQVSADAPVNEETVASSPGVVKNDQILIIPDLAEDSRFKERPYIHTYPHNRFYAGSPIRTSRGVDIGVLCVFDDKPRPEGLSEDHKEVLLDIASNIMHYFDSNRLRLDSRRNERMVRGIGSFVEGSSTLAGWWSNTDTSSYDLHGDSEGALDATQQDLAKQARIDPVSGRETASGEDFPPATPQDERRPSDGLNNISRHDHAQGLSLGQGLSAEHLAASLPTPVEIHSTAVRTTFAKAANIIRESLEVEGVIFLDARISTFGGLVPQLHCGSTTSLSESTGDESPAYSTEAMSTSDRNHHDEQSPAPEDNPVCKVLAFATSDNSTINESTKGGQYQMTESTLKSFVRRYPTGTVFNFDKIGVLQSSDSENSNEAVLTLRPDAGSPSVSKSISPQNARNMKKGRKRSKINDASVILRLISGARAAVFFPLWDYDRQRWFSGAIAWTSRARPFTTRGELSFLAAFGNTIMSQVARLDALVVDKAKTDLLGSISHELRSPLHGVLGGVEMLADTDIDPFQNDVLHTIETCGKTLLDAMDHLLDFAKINNLSHDTAAQSKRGRGSRRSRRQRGQQAVESENFSIESGMRRLFADVELDILVEEVVESVCAGQQFFSRHNDSPERSPTRKATSNTLTASTSVAVILDLDYANVETPGSTDSRVNHPSRDWSYNIVPGGFRRILMNIVGNALKYTDNGSIRVSLSSKPTPTPIQLKRPSSTETIQPQSRNTTLTDQVVLRIADTGRGISPSFLDNQMFLPFTQEDRLNPGTGLGLSIAQQIISNLNGTTRVRSDVGIGTEFTITLPLPRSQKRQRSRESSDTTNSSNSKELDDHIKAAKGLRVALVGFSGDDADPLVRPGLGGRRGSYEAGTEEWTLPRAEIENICSMRLAMEVLPAPVDKKKLSQMVPRPEILLTTEQYLDQLTKDLIDMRGLGSDHVIPPIVAVCSSIAVAKTRAQSHKKKAAIVDFISQPCGPRKLADAFALSLTRWAEEKGREESESPSPVLKPPTPELAAQREELTLRPASRHSTSSEKRNSASGPKEETVRKRDGFLLVEDNPINMRILTSFMRKNRLPHDTAENGLMALESFKEKHATYSYIFMDISMPIMTGLEASREIRAFEKQMGLQPVIIIALTALASESVQQEAFASGIDLFLTKPVRLKELGEVIKKRREGSDGSGGSADS